MNLLCPGCLTPLPASALGAVTCASCELEVDLSRQDTVAGKPRFLPERSFEGQTIEGFVVQGRVGAGGMGTVYRAHQANAAQETREPGVALKFLSSWMAGDPTVLARFAREVEVLRKLQHPGIVSVMADGVFAGVPWFAMPFVKGPTLKQRLDEGVLSWAEALNVFVPLLDALAYAHAQGVVHRDLKPSNVLLDAAGPKLADFGIAQIDVTGNGRTALTHSAAIMGTLPYMSPEQRQGKALDKRSDLYSFGVIAYEALCGQLPQGAFAPPSRLRPSLPRGFDKLVQKLLQPEPQNRYGGALEVQAALKRLAPQRRRRGYAWAAAGLATCLALGSQMLWPLNQPKRAAKVASKPMATAPVLPSNVSELPAAPVPPPPAVQPPVQAQSQSPKTNLNLETRKAATKPRATSKRIARKADSELDLIGTKNLLNAKSSTALEP